MKTAKLKIEYREFGAVVLHRGRVVFRSTATDARHACKLFVDGWREEEASDCSAIEQAPANIAELVQW
jgi:hypothetical protein